MDPVARVQSLVGAAGEALGFRHSPLATDVGMKVAAATRADLEMEDWSLNMEVCDMINCCPEGPEQGFQALRRRLQTSAATTTSSGSPAVAVTAAGEGSGNLLLTLTLLETAVKNCGSPFLLLVCQKDFLDELVELAMPPVGRERVLCLLQSWAAAFSSDPACSSLLDKVLKLGALGVVFPPVSEQEFLLHTTAKVGQGDQGGVMPPPQYRRQASKGGTRLSAEQVVAIKRDLEVTRLNVEVFGELLTELTPGQEHPEDKRMLVEVGKSCKEMQGRLLELLASVDQREITALLLDINDDINNQMLRYERYNNNVKQRSGSCISTEDILLVVASESCSTVDSPSKLTSYPEIDLEGNTGGPEFSSFVNDCAQTDETDKPK